MQRLVIVLGLCHMQDKLLPTVRICCGKRYTRSVVVWACLAVFVTTRPAVAIDFPSPVALLRGVEIARTKHYSMRVRLEIRYLVQPGDKIIKCLFEVDGDKRRIEKFPGEQVHGQVNLRDGEVLYRYVREKFADVQVYDKQGASGVLAFDPRVLGLADLMPNTITIKDCLWYENPQQAEVIGVESMNGDKVWRVRAGRGDATSEFWIEEPSFRVHRRTIKFPGHDIDINSEFDSSTPSSPYPSRVMVKRKDPAGETRVNYTIESFEVGAHISPERFTLKSMELPINTPVVDYRISRIVGYWDGEGLSKEPVYRGQQPSAPRSTPPTPPAGNRFLLIAINVFVLLVSITVLLLRWRRRTTQTQ
jgi:hypothetical protein